MTSKERVLAAIDHRAPDRIPVDFGGTSVTGIHVSCVAALRDYYGLEHRPVKVHEPGQMLGLVEEDLKQAMGLDVNGVFRRKTKFGFPAADWKSWRTHQGLDVLVPGGFNTTTDTNGDTLIYPEGDITAPPSGRMPSNGYFFDAIIRQDPIVEEELNPEDNLEEFQPITDDAVAELKTDVETAAAGGRGVIASFGGTGLGDVGVLPAAGLKHPKGIRDIAEWYISTSSRRDYIHAVFSRQYEIALGNLAKIHAAIGNLIDVVYLCGTDFGTQSGTFCSVKTFRDLWFPYYRRINDWVHANTSWKTFKHSCGSVDRFVPSFIEAGFDILNPVQCSAANMEPEHLKTAYGEQVVFWGGGIDTQKVLPFGTPAEVRQQVLERCRVFSRGGGFVFNSIHNVQAETPTENIVAMIEAVREFNGEKGMG
ncbi:MAG: uroporphyrinogen decarboxylase family protein [Bryobacteraceae bacterium]